MMGWFEGGQLKPFGKCCEYNYFIRRYHQSNMQLLHFCIVLAIFSTAVSVATITGIHNSTVQATYYHAYSFTGGANTKCKVEFTTPSSSLLAYPAIMYAGTSNSTTFTTDISYYLHKTPQSISSMDLDSANRGQPQTVQVTGLSGATTIFIHVFANSVYAFNYTITVTQTNIFTTLCNAPGTAAAAPSPYCTSCGNSLYSGVYCNIYDRSLSNNSQVTQLILSGKYYSFTIPSSSSQISLNYASDLASANIFIQFKTFSGQYAGFFNVVPTGNSYASFLTITPSQTSQVSINSGGSDVLVGVLNQNASPINFSISYSTTATVNILVIVLGVLGGLLLIALIVVACFVIRRMRNPSQIIHPRNSAAMLQQAQIQENTLTAQEIQIYFPSVQCKNAFVELQSSSMNLNSQNNNQNVDRDCVICLCPVDVNELMKVTYCRHIFHSHCLVQWFKKQRNCPYCREEYTKQSTIEHYQKLLKQSNRNMLAGQQLVKQIIKSKALKSSILIEDVKD